MSLSVDMTAAFAASGNRHACPFLTGKLAAPGGEIVRTQSVSVPRDTCVLLTRNGRIEEACAQPGEYRYESCAAGSRLGIGSTAAEGVFFSFRSVKDPAAAGQPRQLVFLNLEPVEAAVRAEKVPLRFTDGSMGLDYTASADAELRWTVRIADAPAFYAAFSGQLSETFGAEQLQAALQGSFRSAAEQAFALTKAEQCRPDELSAIYPVLESRLADAAAEPLRAAGLETVSVKVGAVTIPETDLAALNGVLGKYDQVRRMEEQIAALAAKGTAHTESDLALRDAMVMLETMPEYSPFRKKPDTEKLLAGLKKETGAETEAQAAAAEGTPPEPAAPEEPAVNNEAAPRAETDPDSPAAEPEQQEAPSVPEEPETRPIRAEAPERPAGHRKKTGKQRWVCACGRENSSNFCMDCGKPRPVTPPKRWICACGAENGGKFCMECGTAYASLWES